MLYHKTTINKYSEWKKEDRKEIVEMNYTVVYFIERYQLSKCREILGDIIIQLKTILKKLKSDFKQNHEPENN